MDNKFEELGVSEEILNALNDIEIYEPSEIQSKAIGPMLEGLDIIGQAQTGTGKTFAYGIPTIMNINASSYDVEALILSPTRELSIQVFNELEKLTKYKENIRIATVYGGESYEKQIRALKRHPQIVVGTPGRIIDLMERKYLKFQTVKLLVLDEADEMLKMGFQEDLEKILAQTPDDRQTALFSATMPDFIRKVAKKYQHEPVNIQIKKKTLTVDKINQYVYYCKRDSKKDLLIRTLDYYNFNSCIIFSNTKAMVDELVLFLQKEGYKADGIHGDLKQLVRDRVMNSFRNGLTNILVATDVAARGIDVGGLDGVINYDLPQEDELYVHRIGRTGRAGEFGISVSIATPFEKRRVADIERFTKKNMEYKDIPSVKEILDRKALRLFDKIASNIDAPIENNLVILNKLASSGLDTTKIINCLINMTSQATRAYNNIDTIKQREPRVVKMSNSSGSKEYIYAHLNIGKKELLRPQQLLSLMEKTVGVRKGNVGDIVIRKSGTNIEITKGSYAYLKKLDGYKFQGTRISVKKVFSLDD